MSKINSLIEDFSTTNLITFLRASIPSFKPDDDDLDHLFPEDIYDKYESIIKIGEAEIDKDELIVIASKTNEPLTERTGKKNQYEIAKIILKHEVKDASLFVFYDDEGNFRFSFVKANYLGTKRDFTDFKRYTYFVTPSQTNKTFIKQVGGCNFNSLDEIIQAFSVEPLNKQFYQDIAKSFYGLIGGKVKIRSRNIEFDTALKLPSTPVETNRKIYQEFAVRLIGRTIFCWFLKSKKSENSIPLVPESWLSSRTVVESNKEQHNYYHSILEKLFFLVLNKKQVDRKDYALPKDQELIPFLNGGLFEAQLDDFFPTNSKGIHQIAYDLNIPNQWFIELFEVLEQYNFTIDENSIYDAEVSIDPEMLGTIFENLLAEIDPDTEKSARKATGSFYTPREIVDYMVEQSLVQYLKTKVDTKNEEQLLELFKEGGENQFESTETKKILEALSDVKILDPACGSGAFPMGALHKIINALQKLDPDATWWKERQIENVPNALAKQMLKEKLDGESADYVRKLGVIQNSIYGVDIQPIASEISKLRSFLSLVIDETIIDDAKNRGIQALPNLEFKFVTANTLIGLEEKQQSQGAFDFGQTDELQDQLKTIRNQYLQAYGEEKVKLKKDFEKLQNRIFKQEIAGGGQNKRAQQLVSWKPFSNDSNIWFDPFWMYGVREFDIIIGNPPYIGQKGNKEKFQKVKKSTLGKYHQRRMDYFYFFFHSGIDLLKENGVLGFITTNYYLTATYSDKLRKHIYDECNILTLFNFNEYKLFNSATGQHNLITILKKSKSEDESEINDVSHFGLYSSKELYEILHKKFGALSFKQSKKQLFEKDTLFIRIRNIQSNVVSIHTVLDKVKTQGVPMDRFLNLEQGVLSGADKTTANHIKKYSLNDFNVGEGIFIISKDELDSLNLTFEEKKEFIKPIYKNSDIEKWSFNPEINEYVIYIKSKGGFNEIPSSIKKHLDNYKTILVNRNLRAGKINFSDYQKFLKGELELSYVMNANSMKVGNYYCISYPRNGEKTFERIKIVNSRRAKSNVFALQESKCYEQSDIVVSTLKNNEDDIDKLLYICCIINSKLIYQWLYHRGKRKGNMLELFQQPLKSIPIKFCDSQLYNKILEIGKKLIVDNKNHSLEIELNLLINKLYNLTYEEVKLIDKKFDQTQEEYDNYQIN